MNEVISFFLNNMEYAFGTKDGFEVLKPVKFTGVPLTPRFIKGIFSVRGQLLTLVDLKKRLGLKSSGRPLASSLVLVAGDGHMRAGFLVDKLGGVKGYDRKDLTPAKKGDGFLKGIVKCGGGLIRVLDMEKVLTF
ncbi:MAG: hypothetical protein BMS9Abin23_0203 [Thermodesulfobacteriota bacterium]|nr:MAG: hypothetical protein BMS9Abin23_0203 [Thermodesulfobacteriota bacterium]